MTEGLGIVDHPEVALSVHPPNILENQLATMDPELLPVKMTKSRRPIPHLSCPSIAWLSLHSFLYAKEMNIPGSWLYRL